METVFEGSTQYHTGPHASVRSTLFHLRQQRRDCCQDVHRWWRVGRAESSKCTSNADQSSARVSIFLYAMPESQIQRLGQEAKR
ncbi:hypothetical protein CHS0354_023145 [Potamilus streckersoni]|uniref:Uncharacterized protein n=1 Tax=Potamilus streckersoni TaxID=2493646 RepID=A0AAE0RNA5_9BIVA|nr:hypothetical protein CHS0354_023145 [Potamilus streckersoni]